MWKLWEGLEAGGVGAARGVGAGEEVLPELVEVGIIEGMVAILVIVGPLLIFRASNVIKI